MTEMKASIIILAILSLAVSGCVQPQQEHNTFARCVVVDSADASVDSIYSQADSVEAQVDSVEDLSVKHTGLDAAWLPYLDEMKEDLRRGYKFPPKSEYFLYDITGDGKDELWIRTMSCEADAKVNVFALRRGKPRQIYEGNGFHTDFFVFEGKLLCVSCWMGSGWIYDFRYVDGALKDHSVKFSAMNEECKAKSNSAKANKRLEYWENNHDEFIEFKDL